MIRSLLLSSSLMVAAVSPAAAREAMPMTPAAPAAQPTAPAAAASALPAGQAPSAATPAMSQTDVLKAFYDRYDADELARSPISKAYRGIIDADYGKWDDMSDAAAVAEEQANQWAIAELHKLVPPDRVEPANKLSYQLFEVMIARSSRAFRFRHDGYLFDQMNGAQSELPAFLINIHQVKTKADAEAYVSRLNGLGKAIDDTVALSQARAAKGTVPPKWVYPYVISDAQNVVTGFPFTKIATPAPLYEDFKGKVDKLAIPQVEKDRLIADATTALITVVGPAYRRMIDALTAQEKLAGRDDGIWRFTDGEAYYNERLAYYTTTGMTAAQIHQTGLDQVARIHGEMRALMKQVKFKGTLPQFFAYMRTSKKFYAPNTDAGRQLYLAETEKAKQAVTALLPQWFGILPKAALVVKPVEKFREKSAGKAFYQDPTPDGSRPGTYYVNLYDMNDMPLTEVEALFYHEGLPGHHLQLAIQNELKDVPPFRQFGSYTAYVEGWGLYSEKLAKEMGLYKDPYRNFGRLQLELHRAIRLVVDTGIHAKKWTREQAINYVQTNSADAPGGIVKAIERYIVYPGQATAYMIGRLKITELREKARAALGPKFDIRAFHDLVLGSGPVPLGVLEQRVNDWVAQRKGG